jgi:hypothetical protein
MSIEQNKDVVGRWFTDFWGPDYNPAVIDELAHPDIRFEYSLHQRSEAATPFVSSRPTFARHSRTWPSAGPQI